MRRGDNLNFTKKNKVMLFVALILLNIIIRIPTFPHEMGDDSFQIHSLTKSISNSGYADWASNPIGLFGEYVTSKFPGVEGEKFGSGFPSSVPFFVSSISQLSNINIETIILFSGIFLGILGAVFSFALANEIENDDIFSFFTAFSFSLSPIILRYGIWTSSTRHMFMVLILLFIFVFIKLSKQIEHKNKYIKYIVIIILLILLLIATHRMFLLTSMIIIAYITSIIVKKLEIKLFIKNKQPMLLLPWVVLFIILLLPQLLKLGFFERYNISSGYQSGYFFKGDQWYMILLNMIIDYASNIGVLIFFSLIGLVYLLNKNNKNLTDLFLIIFLLIFAVISSYGTYLSLFIIPFSSLLIGMGFMKIATTPAKKIFKNVLFIIILSSIFFSIFMLWHWQVISPSHESDNIYMTENTFNAVLFINNFNYNSTVISNYNERQLDANLNSSVISIINTAFFNFDYLEAPVQEMIGRYNIHYYIDKTRLSGLFVGFDGITRRVNSLMHIIKQKDRIYDNGELSILYLEKPDQ